MSFSFLNPILLWAIPLSLLPLILHLLFKRPPKVVSFSDLRFLKKIFEQYRPQKKLREWLILLFRILTLFSLFLFFSRPVLHWGGQVGSVDSVALVILLDGSYSMRYQQSSLSHWDRATHLAQTALNSLRARDRSALLIFSDKIDFFSGILTNDHHKLIDKLNEFQPTYRNTDFLLPLQIAYQSLSDSSASNKVILIFSDMAKHGWLSSENHSMKPFPKEDWISQIKNFDPAIRILYPKFPEQKRNVAVENVQFYPDPYTSFLKVEADIKNWGSVGETNLPVSLSFLGEGQPASNQVNRSSEISISLDPMEKKRVTLKAPLVEGEILSGEVRIRADHLAVDDIFYFTHSSPKKMKVLCVEELSGIAALSGESYFLRQALGSPPYLFELETVSLNEMSKNSLDSYHTIILVNPADLDINASRILSNYIKSGGSLLVTLGERSGVHRLESIKELLPATLHDFRQTSSLSLSSSVIVENEAWGRFRTEYDWGKIRVEKIVQTTLKENSQALISLSDGTPLLIFSQGTNQSPVLTQEPKIALWTSTIDRSWNNLPSKPVFAPLMRSILEKLGSHSMEDSSRELRVGEPFKKKFSSLVKREAINLFSFSNNKLDFRMLGKEMISSPLEEPGFYSLVWQNKKREVKEKIPVNVESRRWESDCSRITEEELKTILPQTTFISLASGDRFPNEFAAALSGKELSRFFLILAAFFLVGEMILKRV